MRFLFGRFHGSAYVDIINTYARKNGGAVQYKPKPGTSEYTLIGRIGQPAAVAVDRSEADVLATGKNAIL